MKLAPTVQFRLLWDYLDGPELVEEHKFHPSRKWPADFCHLPSKTIIEIEGGVWMGGRHTRPQGFINDAEKYMEATLLGYTVFRLPPELITEPVLIRIIEFCARPTCTQKPTTSPLPS